MVVVVLWREAPTQVPAASGGIRELLGHCRASLEALLDSEPRIVPRGAYLLQQVGRWEAYELEVLRVLASTTRYILVSLPPRSSPS